MTPATMNVRITELPEVRRVLNKYGRRLDLLLAEHAALHAYLAAGLLHNRTHQHYCDLIDAHDAVANLLTPEDDE